tara:strand:+ start:121 stop:312 length:192 start_codon:yes stop_codon:yes gene_type:complete
MVPKTDSEQIDPRIRKITMELINNGYIDEAKMLYESAKQTKSERKDQQSLDAIEHSPKTYTFN